MDIRNLSSERLKTMSVAITQNRSGSLIVFFCILLLSISCPPSLAQETLEFECVYSNSSSSLCATLCPQGCFYSLLPKPCSPEGQVLEYSDDSRPGSMEQSVIFDNETYKVPMEIISQFQADPDLFRNNFTIAMWFRSLEINEGNLIVIQQAGMNSLELYLESSWLFVNNAEGMQMNTSFSLPYPSTWNFVALDFQTNSNNESLSSSHHANVYLNGTEMSSVSLSVNIMENVVPDIYLAGAGMEPLESSGSSDLLEVTTNMFNGTMQDVGIYSRALTQSELMLLGIGQISVSGASFLPQCLCMADVNSDTVDSQLCDDGSIRYNTSVNDIEFIGDMNFDTAWLSDSGEAVSLVTVEFEADVSLSKIFVYFQSSPPRSLELQYLTTDDSWRALQYYSIDCFEDFQEMSNRNVSSLTDAVCETIDEMATILSFYVIANGRDDYSITDIESVFSTSQIQLITDPSNEIIRIEEIEVCSRFCLNLNTEERCVLQGIMTSSTVGVVSSPTFDLSLQSSSTDLFEPESSFVIEETFTMSTLSMPTSIKLSLSSETLDDSFMLLPSSFVTIETSFVNEIESTIVFESSVSFDFGMFTESPSFQITPTPTPSSVEAVLDSSSFFEPSVFPTPSLSEVFSSSVDFDEEIETTTAVMFDVSSSFQFQTIVPSSTDIVDQFVSSSDILLSEIVSSSDVFIMSSDVFITSSDFDDLISSTFISLSSSEFQEFIISSSEIVSSSEFFISSSEIEEVVSTTEIFFSSSEFDEMIMSSDFLLSSSEAITSQLVTPSELVSIDFSSSELVFEPTSTVEFITSSEVIDFENFSSSELIVEPTSTLEFISSSEVVFEPTSTVEFITSSEVIDFENSSSSELVSEPTSTVEFITSSEVIDFENFSSSELIVEPTSTLEFISSSEVVDFEETSSLLIPETSSEDFIFETTSVFPTPEPTIDFEISSSEIFTSSLEFEVESSSETLVSPSPSFQTEQFSSSIDLSSSFIDSELTSSLEFFSTVSVSPTLEFFSSSEILEFLTSSEVFSSSIEIESTIFSISPSIEFSSNIFSPLPSPVPTSSLIVSSSFIVEELSPSFSEDFTAIFETSSIFPSVSSEEFLISSSPVIIESSLSIEVSSSIEEFASSDVEISPTPSFTEDFISSSSEIEVVFTSSGDFEVSSTVEIVPSSSLIEEAFSSELFTSSDFFISPTPSLVLSPSPSPSLVLSPSPSPSLVLSPSPSPSPTTSFLFPSISVTPTMVVSGSGVLLSDSQVLEDNSSYSFEFGSFGVLNDNQLTGSVSAQLGSYSTPDQPFNIATNQWISLIGTTSRATLWIDDPTFTLAIQVRDKYSNTVVREADITITALHSSGASAMYTCTIPETAMSGTCKVDVVISNEWFTNYTTSVMLSARNSMNSDNIYIANVTLNERLEVEFTNDTLYLKLPSTPVVPDKHFTVSINARYPYKVGGFNIDCNMTGTMEISRAVSPNYFSLLSSLYKNETNRIALSGFRNRDQFSIRRNANDLTELLVTLTLKVLSSEGNHLINCKTKGLTLTTRQIIVPSLSITSLPVQALSRDGELSDNGIILTETNSVVGLFPYISHNTFINFATVNNTRQDLGAIMVYSLYRDGTFSTTVSNIRCTTVDFEVMQVSTDCLNLFFNTSETKGDMAEIVVIESGVSSVLPVRVWYTNTNFTLELDDDILNKTDDSCGNGQYQSSSVSILGSITHLGITREVDFSSLLMHRLVVSDTTVATITNNVIEGLSPGSSDIYLGSMSWGYTPFQVSDEYANPLYLSIFVFSEINVDIGDSEIELENPQRGNVSILQDFIYMRQDLHINTLLVYDDSSIVDVDSSKYLQLTTDDSLITNNVYTINELNNFVTIYANWSQCPGELVEGMITVNISSVNPQSIKVTASSYTLTVEKDLAVNITDIPTNTQLVVMVIFEDERYNEIIPMSDIELVISNHSVVTNNGDYTIQAVAEGTVDVLVIAAKYNLMETVTLDVVVSTLDIHFTPYPFYDGSDDILIDSLHLINSTDIYQQAMAVATLKLSNESVYTVPDAKISETSQYLNIENYIVTVDQKPSNTSTVTVTASVGEIDASTELTISTAQLNVEIVKIDFVSELIGVVNIKRIADCEITLSDGTKLVNSFNSSGYPLYDSLVTITSGETAVSVESGTSIVTLHQSSREEVTLYCSAGGVVDSVSFIANTLPSEGGLGLGRRNTTHLFSEINNTFSVPVSLNSSMYRIGAFAFNVRYDQVTLDYLSTEQQMGWDNGSLVVVENPGLLKFSGVLNTGVISIDFPALIANMVFQARTNGDSELSATPRLLAEATIQLTDRLESPITNNLPVNVNANTMRRKRSALEQTQESLHRSRRATENCPPNYSIGDVNGDCFVDIRDVYYFQEYSLASVHDFQGSSDAENINNNVQMKNIVLDIDGDGIISLDDAIALEQITAGLVYEITANYSINRRFCDCVIEIDITLSTSDGQSLPTDTLHVFTHISHESYNSLNSLDIMDGEVLHRDTLGSTIHTSLVRASLSSTQPDDNSTSLYRIEAMSSQTLSDIGFSFIQAITDDNQLIESRIAGLFGNRSLVEATDPDVPFMINVTIGRGESAELVVDDLRPHFIIDLACPIETPPTPPPSLPLMLSTSGIGYVSGPLIRTTDDSNLVYEAKVTLFNNGPQNTRGVFNVEIENIWSDFTYSRSSVTPTSLENPIIVLDQARSKVFVYVQVYNTDQYLYSIASVSNVTAMITFNGSSLLDNVNCICDNTSGICSTDYDVVDFNGIESLSVNFQLGDITTDTTTISIAQKLNTSSINNQFGLVLPSYAIPTGSEFTVDVYVHSTSQLISFVLTISSDVPITKITSENALWGVTCNSGTCIGYLTNFQSFSDEQSSQPEYICTLTLTVPISYSENTIPVSIAVNETFDKYYNSIDLANAVVVNTSGSFETTGIVGIISDEVVGLFVYTEQTEIFNTAVLDGGELTIPITTKLVQGNGSIIDPSAGSLNCEVTQGMLAIQVRPDCSELFLNGSETAGADTATVMVTHLASGNNRSLHFKIWFPQTPVQLQLDRTVLKRIRGVVNADNCSLYYYQSTNINAYTSVETDTEQIDSVDVSDLILNQIEVEPAGGVVLNITERTIRGLYPSNVLLTSSKSGLVIETVLNVSNDFVTVQYLYSEILTRLSIEQTTEDQQQYKFTINVDNTFDYHNETGTVVTIAQLSDGTYLTVTDQVSLQSSTSAISIDGSSIVALSNVTDTQLLESTWSNSNMCSGLETYCVKTNAMVSSISIPQPILVIMSDTIEIASSNAITNLSGIPYSVNVSVYLQYSGDVRVDVTRRTTNDLSLTVDDNGFFTIDGSMPVGNNQVMFAYNDGSISLSETETFNIIGIDKVNSELVFKQYPTPDDSSLSICKLRKIENSSVYEQAMITGNISLSNGQTVSLATLTDDQYTIESNNSNVTIDNRIVKAVSEAGETTVSLKITGLNDAIVSSMITVSGSVAVTSIELIEPVLSGLVNSVIDLDASITLQGGSRIPSLHNSYSVDSFLSLVAFTSDNDAIISINNNGQAVLLQNSQCKVTLTVTIMGSNKVNENKEVVVDLLPSVGGLDLAVTDDTQVEMDSVFSVDVFLNTGDNTVNAIESALMYDSDVMKVLNVSVADTQWSGGVFLYSLVQSGVIKFGGVSLNEGLLGTRLHIARVFFTAIGKGNGELYGYVSSVLEFDMNNQLWNQLPISDNIESSRVFVTVSDTPLCSSFSLPSFAPIQTETGNCNSFMIDNEVYTCPMNLSTTGSLISDILNGSPNMDPNRDGQYNSLDPLYTTQVTFDVLAILQSLPTLANTSRDESSNACDVTISATLDLANSMVASDSFVNVWFLLDLKGQSFSSLFNTTNPLQYVSMSTDVVLLSGEYNQTNGQHTVTLQTSLTKVILEDVPLSLIQVSNGVVDGSPAGIFPMVSKTGSSSMSLPTTTLEGNFTLSISDYSPLYTINQTITCPPLPLPEIEAVVNGITTQNRSIVIILTVPIERNQFKLMLYSCDRLEYCSSYPLSRTYNSHDNWTISNTEATIKDLMPYHEYYFYFESSDRNSTIFNASTTAARPEGFNNVSITRQPESLLVKWAPPTYRNGEFERVFIMYTILSKKRAIQPPFNISNVSQTEFNITNLTIASKYTVDVIYYNSVGASNTVKIMTNTTFPEPTINITNSSGCINVSITQKYSASDINYKIALQCEDIETEVDNGTGNVNDMEMEITICHEQIMGINGTYCSGDNYTVIVTLTRNAFTVSSSETTDIPIIVIPSTTSSQSTTTAITSTSLTITPSSQPSPTPPSSSIPSSSSTTVTASTTTSSTFTASSPASTSTSTMSTSTTSSTMSTNTSTVGGTASSADGGATTVAAVAVVSIVILGLLVVLIVMIVVWFVRRGKKTGSLDIYSHRPVSRSSKDIFFHMEETVEMSPIDIVPVGHHYHRGDEHFIDETVMGSMGIIENKNAYHTGDSQIPTRDGTMGNGKHPPPRGSQRVVTFNEDKPHLYYRQQQQEDYYDDDDEEDELIDLRFQEDMISQPYLSLGLTPISQLSPDPLMSNSTGTSELGFFPSMPPPMSPITSMMNMAGISVDVDDNNPALDNLIMPDGMVSYNLAPVNQHKSKNKVRPEQRNDSNGRLETLMEHSSLEADDLSSSFNGLNSKGNSILNTSMSTSEDDEFIFPSADGLSPLTTRKGKKSSSAIALDFDSDFGGLFSTSFNANSSSTSMSKLHQPSSNGNVGNGNRHMAPSFMDFDAINPKDQSKQRRQNAREKAKAEQKALLLQREREEEMRKAELAKERQDKIANEYAKFMAGSGKNQPSVLQQIGKFEAVAELQEEKKSQELIASPTRSPRYGGLGGGIVSPLHSYSARPRKPSNDSLDPKPLEDQVTIL